MFVSIACDLSNEDHRLAVYELLRQYGFTMILNNVFETATIKENRLSRLKRDIDRITDYYDKLRFYQYPLDDTLVISFLSNKKWRKTFVKV